jgi:hypothetical protein
VSANYLTGLGLDQPFIRTARSSTNYYLSDALGSIVGLASTTGSVPTTYTYDPYGKTTATGISSANFLGFSPRVCERVLTKTSGYPSPNATRIRKGTRLR